MNEQTGIMDPEAFVPRRQQLCSEPLANCFIAYRESFDSFMFLIDLVVRVDETQKLAKDTLAKLDKLDGLETLGDTAPDDEPPPTQKALKRFSRTNSENLVNNSVNAFQRYFSQIVQECIRKRPDILTTNEQISIRDIVKFKRMSDVIELLVERKVNKLAYEGLLGIESYFDEHLGLKLFLNENERQLTREFVELRNINVHNGGVVNSIFLERIGKNPTRPFRLGKRFHVDWDEFCEYAANMIAVTSRLDAAACQKFSIRRKKLATWISLNNS